MILEEFDKEKYEHSLRKEGQTQINLLNQKLMADGRMDDFMRSINDVDFQNQLLKEYNL